MLQSPYMIRRGIFDVIGIVLCMMAPWWVVLVYGFIGTLLFPWYLEYVLMFAWYDAVFGYAGLAGYLRIAHTLIVGILLLGIEYIKTNLTVSPRVFFTRKAHHK